MVCRGGKRTGGDCSLLPAPFRQGAGKREEIILGRLPGPPFALLTATRAVIWRAFSPPDPSVVLARFQRHDGGGIVGEQQSQGYAIVEDGSFVQDLAGGIQDTDIMAAITEIEAESRSGGTPVITGAVGVETTEGAEFLFFVFIGRVS